MIVCMLILFTNKIDLERYYNLQTRKPENAMKPSSPSRWPRLTRLPLAWEITLVLLVKLAIVIAIRQAFFAQPQAKKMRVPMSQVEQHLLSVPNQNINTATQMQADAISTQTQPQDHHGSH